MIAIISDFQNSEYLGVMKGVILSHHKNAKIVDLCNQVRPQQVREAAWILHSTYRYFPDKTVFLCVVDPGVGTDRQALAAKTKDYFFVGPDNGLLFPMLQSDAAEKVVRLPTEGASVTFHGRDVFARAAALLDKGRRLEKLGDVTELRKSLLFYLRDRTGEIVRIDCFGNVITNLPHIGRKEYIVKLGRSRKGVPFFRTYEEAPVNRLFAIEGSSCTLELSVKKGSAAEKLGARVGGRLTIS